MFTVSGVCSAFRRKALDEVDYWDLDMLTEDIDLTWKLQRAHWSVSYEPPALCWILMPETLRGLWTPRLPWAQSAPAAFLKNMTTHWSWETRPPCNLLVWSSLLTSG